MLEREASTLHCVANALIVQFCSQHVLAWIVVIARTCIHRHRSTSSWWSQGITNRAVLQRVSWGKSLYKPHTELRLKTKMLWMSREEKCAPFPKRSNMRSFSCYKSSRYSGRWPVLRGSPAVWCAVQAAILQYFIFFLGGLTASLCVFGFSSRGAAGKLKQLQGITKFTKQFGRSRLVLHWCHDVSSDECGEYCWKQR